MKVHTVPHTYPLNKHTKDKKYEIFISKGLQDWSFSQNIAAGFQLCATVFNRCVMYSTTRVSMHFYTDAHERTNWMWKNSLVLKPTVLLNWQHYLHDILNMLISQQMQYHPLDSSKSPLRSIVCTCSNFLNARHSTWQNCMHALSIALTYTAVPMILGPKIHSSFPISWTRWFSLLTFEAIPFLKHLT